MKRIKTVFILFLAAVLMFSVVSGAMADDTYFRVATPTQLTGRFFTSLWGGTTSDMDVQDMIHGYKLSTWDADVGQYRMNHNVVSGETTYDDENGNRTYYIALYDNLKYSDGTEITAWDYAFTYLLLMDPAISELGGIPVNQDWIYGSDEYLNGDVNYLKGIRVIDKHLLSITVKAEYLPWYFELYRLYVSPYPMKLIAPDSKIDDKGEGVFILPKLDSETLKKTILDSYNGYMTHPKATSGAYLLKEYKNGKAVLEPNPMHNGNENGDKPSIKNIIYDGGSADDIQTISEKLASGNVDLITRVLYEKDIKEAKELVNTKEQKYISIDYPRTGQTIVYFNPDSVRVQDKEVRQAILYCLDWEGMVSEILGKNYVESGYINHMFGKLASEANLRYKTSIVKAIDLLEESNWNMNSTGSDIYEALNEKEPRYKMLEDNTMLDLSLKIAVPVAMKDIVDKYWVKKMKTAGIFVELVPMDMDDMIAVYTSTVSMKTLEKTIGCDMVIVGENNFPVIMLSPYWAKADTSAETEKNEKTLLSINNNLLSKSFKTMKTDPYDFESFIKKLNMLQDYILEELPFIPLYTGYYYDFCVNGLKDYEINDSISFMEAISVAWLDPVQPAD